MPSDLSSPGLNRHDFATDDHRGIHFAEAHHDQIDHADARTGGDRLNPKSRELSKDHKEDK